MIDHSGLVNQPAVSAVAHMVADMVGLLRAMVEQVAQLRTGAIDTSTLVGVSRCHLNRTNFGRRAQWFLALLPSFRTDRPFPVSHEILCASLQVSLRG